jgi:hypothetical protein
VTIDQALENRHTVWVEWETPWPACGPEGNKLTSYCVSRMTVHDAINADRLVAKQRGFPTNAQDKTYLLNFIATHWATLKEGER